MESSGRCRLSGSGRWWPMTAATRFRRTGLLLMIVLPLIAAMSQPASSAGDGGFYPVKWTTNLTVPYSFTPSAEARGWVKRIMAGAGAWNSVGTPMTFVKGTDVSNYDPYGGGTWMAPRC